MDLPDVKSVATTAELFSRAVAGSVLPDAIWGGGDTLPMESELHTGVHIDANLLQHYRDVCGFDDEGQVPVTFPSILGFAAGLRLMTARRFPLRALGMIHLTDRITAERALHPDDVLTVRVHAENLRAHRLGALVDVVTEVRTADDASHVAWQEVSTYLSRGARMAGADAAAHPVTDAVEVDVPDPDLASASTIVSLSGGLGRAFAGVSGDRNPIHMHPLLARAFGFRTTIIHGRWMMARSVAAVADSLTPAVSVVSAFRKPLFIPGDARLLTLTTAQDAQVWLTGVDGTPMHAFTHTNNRT